MMPIPLNTQTLRLFGSEVCVPKFDRSAVSVGIVHVGVGGFHRSHEALYLDDLMNQGSGMDWGICGTSVLASGTAMRDALVAQDGLYTVVVKHVDGKWEPRVVGSIVDYMHLADDCQRLIEQLASPSVRIVSLTVTEGGYNINPATNSFDESNPAVWGDLANVARPSTVFGVVVEALARRRERRVPAFTVMSCDNVQTNGVVAREAFAGYARLRDPNLGKWIAEEVNFPNSMVDRITPQTTDADRREIGERFGIDDRCPVVCEPFCQWVLEDKFGGSRPAFEDVGVLLVPDVEPYEMMKLRMLNAGHQALGYAGYLAGYRLVHEVAQDPLFNEFLRDYLINEAVPTVTSVPGINLNSYASSVIERFSNPQICDTLARICKDTSDRIPKFLLPVIRHEIGVGGPVARATAVVACWARYADGVDESGIAIEVEDRKREQLMVAARRQRQEPLAFLSANRETLGDLIQCPRFTALYESILRSLYEQGVRRTLAHLDRIEERCS
jgi:mannitol 2-dehydrogenase